MSIEEYLNIVQVTRGITLEGRERKLFEERVQRCISNNTIRLKEPEIYNFYLLYCIGETSVWEESGRLMRYCPQDDIKLLSNNISLFNRDPKLKVLYLKKCRELIILYGNLSSNMYEDLSKEELSRFKEKWELLESIIKMGMTHILDNSHIRGDVISMQIDNDYTMWVGTSSKFKYKLINTTGSEWELEEWG